MLLNRLTSSLPTALVVAACVLGGCASSSSSGGFWDRSPCVAGVKGPQFECAPPGPSAGVSAPTPAPMYEDPLLPAPQLSPAELPPPASRARRAPVRQAPPMRASPLRTSPAPSASQGPAQPSTEEIAVLERVNQIRAQRGLRMLRFEPRLWAAATDHSREQLTHGYMGHGSPDSSRDELSERLQLAGYDGLAYAEVVAWGYPDTRSVVEGWMNSRAHREILLDRTMSEAGFSRAGGYWTGNFGSPGPQRGRMSSRRGTASALQSRVPATRAQPRPTPQPRTAPKPRPQIRRVPPTPLPKARSAPANPFELPIPKAKPKGTPVFRGG